MIINQNVSGGGTTPTGTTQITTNGIHDVTNYATADVQVPTTAPEIYRVFRVNNGKIENSIMTPFLPLPSSATDISAYCYYSAYSNTPSSVLFGAVDLSSLTTVSGQYACQNMFQGCSGITNVDLSSLTTVSGQYACMAMFQNCTGITNVDLSSLTTASSNSACYVMFYGCSGITSIDLSSLTTISGQYACSGMFQGCSGITNVDLSSLTTVSGIVACSSMFQGCSNLTKLSFYALDTNSFGTSTNQFNNMLSGCTGVTVHFPIRIQGTIGSWTSVTNGFGGTNTTVLFDIVTSLTGADTNTYTRSQKNSTSTATAWMYNDTLYYTSGTTEPAVNDTIYSDSACTTAVTTISAIA